MPDIKQEQGEKRVFSTGACSQNAEGKGTPVLIPGDAILEIARHFEEGAKIHGVRNWEKGIPLSEQLNSLERHLQQEKMRLTDERHDRALAWRAVCYLATKIRIQQGLLPKELDDMPRYKVVEPIIEVKSTSINDYISKKIDTIYLDMDGVLVNFIDEVNKILGINMPKNKGPMKWNWFEDYGFTLKDVEKICTEEFWAGLDWMPDGAIIFNSVQTLELPIRLITVATGNWHRALCGKIKWLDSHIRRDYYNDIILLHQFQKKSNFASPTSLLIDDNDDNVEEWNEAGGEAILIPRRWNKQRACCDNNSRLLDICFNSYKQNGRL